MKKIRVLALVLCLVTVLCSACDSAAAPKTFSKSGMTIQLTDAFAEKEHVTYTACYSSTEIAVFVLKEEFTLFGDQQLTLDEYAELVITGNRKEAELIKEDGLTYFTFDFTANGKDYTYVACVYEGADAFWLIQFACMASDYEELKPVVLGYAKTVQV